MVKVVVVLVVVCEDGGIVAAICVFLICVCGVHFSMIGLQCHDGRW